VVLAHELTGPVERKHKRDGEWSAQQDAQPRSRTQVKVAIPLVSLRSSTAGLNPKKARTRPPRLVGLLTRRIEKPEAFSSALGRQWHLRKLKRFFVRSSGFYKPVDRRDIQRLGRPGISPEFPVHPPKTRSLEKSPSVALHLQNLPMYFYTQVLLRARENQHACGVSDKSCVQPSLQQTSNSSCNRQPDKMLSRARTECKCQLRGIVEA
jgi:hypothetical protein